MSNTNVVTIKRASTFGAACTYVPEQGGPADLTGVTITSDIRDSKGKVSTNTVVVIDPTHFNITNDDSSAWSLGSGYWDIKFSKNGVVFYSDTVIINIIPQITIS